MACRWVLLTEAAQPEAGRKAKRKPNTNAMEQRQPNSKNAPKWTAEIETQCKWARAECGECNEAAVFFPKIFPTSAKIIIEITIALHQVGFPGKCCSANPIKGFLLLNAERRPNCSRHICGIFGSAGGWRGALESDLASSLNRIRYNVRNDCQFA